MKLLGIQSSKQTTKRVVRRDSVRELQKLLEPFDVSLGEPFDVRPTIRSTDCSTQGKANDIKQIVIASPVLPRIGEVPEMGRIQDLLEKISRGIGVGESP